MQKPAIKIVLAVCLAAIGWFAYDKYVKKTGISANYSVARTAAEKTWPVRGVEANRKDHEIYRTAFGKIKAPATTGLSFQIAGCIQSVGEHATNGGFVEKGEVLARLETGGIEHEVTSAALAIDEITARQDEIKRKIAGLKNLRKLNEEQRLLARASLKRQEKLSGRGFSSDKNIDEAKHKLYDAKSRLVQNLNEQEALDATLNTLQKQGAIARENLKNAETKRDYAVLYAPHAGKIETTSLRAGACVSPMQIVASLVDTSQKEVVLELPVRFYNALLHKQLLDQHIAIQSGPIRLGAAHISHVLPTTDSTTGSVKLILDIATDTPVVANQKVQARVMTDNLTNVVKLPVSALFAGRYLYRIKNGRLEEIEVKPVHQDSKNIFIGHEIEGGDMILTSHISQAKPGLAVQILENGGDEQ